MKLIYKPDNISFDIEKQKINSIVIENPRLLDKMIFSFYDLSDKIKEDWILDDENIKANKSLDLIFSPREVTLNKKSLIVELYKRLELDICDDNLYEDLANIHSKTLNIIDKLIQRSGYLLEIDDIFSEKDYFKLFDIKFAELHGNFAEKLVEYMETIIDLLDKKVFIFLGCEGILMEEDVLAINKWLKYNDIFIVFMTSKPFFLTNDKNEYIIDIDLCELH